MLKPFLIVFGVVVLAGGVQGLIAGSKASIIAAAPLAACLLAGAFLLGSKPTVGLVLALIASLAIAGRFLPVFIKAFDKMAALWPAGVLVVLSVVGLIMTGMALAKR